MEMSREAIKQEIDNLLDKIFERDDKPETYCGSLRAYIDKFHGGVQARFADRWGYLPQHVSQWVIEGRRVEDGDLRSPGVRRKLGE